ncbi:4-hydroxybenzoate--CoA ligase [Sphingomonas hengshuiensis]|uniref:4-hydroxybenzoate--CoA ligase n=1 Tax=Sphingomonas hengshuiensis TaxID=1609977 RepID=A0A7U5BFA0_9SPHN|nr:4-hydroxybenzoate--CoA ligase [Sphingomonas hengshuiensis]
METYNVAEDLIARNLPTRSGKIAFIDDAGRYTFGELAERVERFAGHLVAAGAVQESRIVLCLEDGIDFVTACLGAIWAGVVPVMINPLLTSADFAYLLDDSRAFAVVTSAGAWPAIAPVLDERRYLRHVVFSGEAPAGRIAFADALAAAEPLRQPAPTRADEPCLWQYSSGSTGRPKGTIHTHSAVSGLLDLYPRQILSLSEADTSFSAAKLFFGYGFGNGLVFPLGTGATAVLMAGRPTPAAVFERLRAHQPTIFYGVPTLYQSMLLAEDLPTADELRLRICTSAGEALPADIGERWKARFGIDILDGIGSTEMLHIFLSNRPGDVKYGTTGHPLHGIALRLLDESGSEVAAGEIGELHIKGATSASGYWARRDKTRETFLGEWTRSGDKFRQDADGRFVYCGRSDDMLKVSGIYVSPFEVESVLMTHPDVAEAAVVGWPDPAGLIKPKAYVVLARPCSGRDIAGELKEHVKSSLAPYKYPRWFDFVDALPKTATGKIERYKLRHQK